jgi:hypothetical protein
MLVVSQRLVSQDQKDVLFTKAENIFYLLQLSIFLELKYVLLRYDNCQNFHFLLGHNFACEAHIIGAMTFSMKTLGKMSLIITCDYSTL